jgi:hypothetical protein
MRRTWVVILGVVLLGSFVATASADPITLIVDVGSSASVGMGMSGTLSTGGGLITLNNEAVGTLMHTTQSTTMPGMVGMQSFQQRMITMQFPGIGTVFMMMVGGTPWTGATGIIMGGTDQVHGISGSVTVGTPVGANQYPFTLTLDP